MKDPLSRASFLLSVLPLILLLGALANSRADDNIAARLGLGREGSHIIDTLFRSSHSGFNFGVLVALVLSLAGTIAVARTVQRLYQQVFDHPDVRGWSKVLRCLVWAAVVAAEIVLDAVISRPLRDLPLGRVFLGVGNLVIVTAFLWWGLRYLLRGKESWRRLFSRRGRDWSLLGRPRRFRVAVLLFRPSSQTVISMGKSESCSRS
jgi:hypothetical protein